MEHVSCLQRLAVVSRGLESGGAPRALRSPASLLSQPGGLEGGQDTVCVSAGALGATEMYPVTAGAGGVAKQSCSLGLCGEGEGWVADHCQLPVERGSGHQLL